MSVTATKVESVADAMNSGDPAAVSSAIEEAKLGTMLVPQQWTITGLTAMTAVDITSAEVAALAVAGPATPALAAGGRLPAALCAGTVAVRVTAGVAAVGVRKVYDAGVVPAVDIAALSADGKTLTFEANVTGFVLEYMARSSKEMTAPFATV